MSAHLRLAGGALLALALGSSALAGNPCQTATPIDTLPFLIDEPGLYRVVRNLAGSQGISIASDDVTLDLNGFRLRGDGTSAGIAVIAEVDGLVVRDGTLRNWLPAVDASAATGVRLEHLRVWASVTGGLLAGPQADVRSCLVVDCGGTGIAVGTDSRVSGCVVSGAAAGMDAGADSLVRESLVANGAGPGFILGKSAALSESVAMDNLLSGVLGGEDGVITRCVAVGNLSSGFLGAAESSITTCVATGNLNDGFDLALLGGAVGRARLSSSLAAFNGGRGVRAERASTVEGSVLHGNASDGIRAVDFTTLLGNLVVSNGFGSGIVLEQTDSVVQDNHVVGGSTGINALGSYNEITDNSSQDNTTNYSIAPSNVSGPLMSSGAAAGPYANIDL